MFVLSNAWRALMRSKGRTALTAFVTLAVTFGTVAGLAIIQENTTAHTTTYDAQKADLGRYCCFRGWLFAGEALNR